MCDSECEAGKVVVSCKTAVYKVDTSKSESSYTMHAWVPQAYLAAHLCAYGYVRLTHTQEKSYTVHTCINAYVILRP